MINIIICDKYITPLYYYNYIMVYIYDIINSWYVLKNIISLKIIKLLNKKKLIDNIF